MSNSLTGAQLIIEERQRQIKEEGWTAKHDDRHNHDELAWAAVCYAAPAEVTASEVTFVGQWNCNCRSVDECWCTSFPKTFQDFDDPWPWEDDWDKRDKHDRIRCLVIAGALIAAEIDRLKRIEGTEDE